MDRVAHLIDQTSLSEAILTAPMIVRLGIAVPDGRMRAVSAERLAEAILRGLDQPRRIESDDQLTLGL